MAQGACWLIQVTSMAAFPIMKMKLLACRAVAGVVAGLVLLFAACASSTNRPEQGDPRPSITQASVSNPKQGWSGYSLSIPAGYEAFAIDDPALAARDPALAKYLQGVVGNVRYEYSVTHSDTVVLVGPIPMLFQVTQIGAINPISILSMKARHDLLDAMRKSTQESGVKPSIEKLSGTGEEVLFRRFIQPEAQAASRGIRIQVNRLGDFKEVYRLTAVCTEAELTQAKALIAETIGKLQLGQ